jgi:hypothetical protein
VFENIPENDLYGTSVTSAVYSASQSASELERQSRGSVEKLRAEETSLCRDIEQRRCELKELEERVREMREEDGRLRQQQEVMRVLTQRVDHLREEEARLCEERRNQSAPETGLAEGKLRERELEVQRRLDEASDRESANRQENLRLQRLADQLHMQKKDLDHREFDLENFRDDRPGVLDEQRAELREREKRLHQQESDVSARERELDQRQTNFQKWMNKEQALIHQKMSELGLGEPGQSSGQPYVPPSHPPSHSSPYNPHTVTPSHANYTHQFPGSPSQPSHYSPHTVTPSHTYTHQFPGSPSQPSHYSPHTVTPSQHGMQFTPSHIPPTHTPSDGGPYGAVASTGYPTGVSQPSTAAHTLSYSSSPGYSPGTAGAGFSQFSSTHPPTTSSPSSSSSVSVVSSASSVVQREKTFTHAGHHGVSPASQALTSGYNDLSNPPPPTTTTATQRKNDSGVIRSGSTDNAAVMSGVGVASGGVGVAIGGVGVASGGVRSNHPATINIDEELAHHLGEYSSPSQTTDEISADEEYARQLYLELNPAPPDVNRDRELALAMFKDELPDAVIPDSPTGSGLQNILIDTLKKREEQQLQEQRDAELARTLGGEPVGQDQLNDLGS